MKMPLLASICPILKKKNKFDIWDLDVEQIKAFVLPLENVVHNFVSIKLQLGNERGCTKDTNKTDQQLNESVCQSLPKKCAGHEWDTAWAEQCEESSRDMSQHKELNFSEN